MTLWLTADQHWGHERIIELAGRPFRDLDHMHHVMVERWNDLVRPSDEVLILGDWCMGRIADTLPVGHLLHGHKFLVPGNHDRMFGDMTPEKRVNWMRRYEGDGGLSRVLMSPWGRTHAPVLDPLGVALRTSHFPYAGDSGEKDRFVDQRPADDGSWLAHGHVHEKWLVSGRMINVGVDVWDFAPAEYVSVRALAFDPVS